jgi:malate dehydrogenase
MGLPKVSVIGAGHVGETTAHAIARKNLANVVLLDIVEDMPQGKALDMMEAAPVEGWDVTITGTNDYKDTANSDIVVITAGVPRKPGMSRDDLLKVNAEIVGGVVDGLTAQAGNPILLVVSNPLDVMTYLTYDKTGYPKNRVFGMAGVLDSTRFRCFIAMELGCSVREVSAMVLGGHGDTMVPLTDYATVSGIPIKALIPKERIDAMVQRTRVGGGEIVKLLKTGSAYYAPAAAVAAMVESVTRDQGQVLACCTLLEGEYGIKGVFAGVPTKLGANGVEQVIELKLGAADAEALKKSAEHVRETIEALKKLMG